MLKIHTSDGQTIRIDLRDPEQAREWMPRLEQDRFQASISGMSLVEFHEVRVRCPKCGTKASDTVGVQHSLSRPQGLADVRYDVERAEINGKFCERVTVTAGEVLLSVIAHESQQAARVSLFKSGRRRYAPKRHTE